MPTPSGAFAFSTMLESRGIDLTTLGAAYLVLIATALLTAAAYVAVRRFLVVSPNRWTRDFGIYTSLVLAALLIAIVLENESLPRGSATLHYTALPQLLLSLGVYLTIWYRQEPRLVALGAAATAATLVVGAFLGMATTLLGPAYWVTLSMLAVLLGFVWRQAISTKHGFFTASSIYIRSKETLDAVTPPQKPWLGLTQWVALIGASISLAVGNSLLRGSGIEEVPAVEVAAESVLLIVVTALVCAVPAVGYWLTRKAWMPELTRFAWLAWIVVGFAFTYGNYLNVLARA